MARTRRGRPVGPSWRARRASVCLRGSGARWAPFDASGLELCGLLVSIMLVASQNRGGLLAIMIPVAFVLPFTRLWRRGLAMGR